MFFWKSPVLLASAALVLAGCVTTQTMPDGSTKVRITNKPTSNAESTQGNGLPGSAVSGGITDGNGVVSLIPVDSPNKPRGAYPVFLGGRFTYECMTELLYAAKNGTEVHKQRGADCRQEYLIRQKELKRAGKPYDTKAPVFGLNPASDNAYWQALVDETLTTLRGAKQFQIRFAKIAKISPSGQITVRPSFGNDSTNNYVMLRTVPADVPVLLDDVTFANKISTNPDNRKNGFGDWITCTGAVNFLGTVDHKTGNNYGRYEVQFNAVQMGCKEARMR